MQDNNIPPAEADEFSRAFNLYVRVDELREKGDEASKAEAERASKEARFGTHPGEAADEAWSAYWAWAGEMGEEISRLRTAAASTTGSERESSARQIKEMQEKLKQRDQEIQYTAEHGYSLELKRIAIELRKEARDWYNARSRCAQVRAPHTAPAEAHQEDAEPTKPKRETQADRIARWVGECERRAADAGEPLDRRRMPGKKAEFLDLLHALDAELRSIKTVDSLDRYLAGCKWAGGRQPSAAPLFARLFPEARIRVTGAVSVQRRKA